MYKVAVIGYGYVGKGMHRLFGDWVTNVYDPVLPQSMWMEPQVHVNDNTKARDCDLAIVSVFTPQKEDGTCDTSIVEEVVNWIEAPLILIKSTVQPGTTDMLAKKTGKRIAFSPEYLGEGKYFTPFWKYPDPQEVKYHTFMIAGGARETTAPIIDIFTKKMGPHVFYAQTNAVTAEVVKYMENSWGAMKVIFANEWFEICKAHGVDYREARELWALDSRVEKMHTAVFPKARGFGGKCFPKDVSAIIEATKKKGFTPKLMEVVRQLNEVYSELSEK